MKLHTVAAVAALGLALSGCATVFEGTSQEISVVTNPPGASCSFERQGMQVGTIASTPGTANIRKSKYDIWIKCDKAGFQQAQYLNHSGTTATIAGNVAADLILTAGLSSIVDSADGADNKYDSAVNITLIPVSAAPLPSVLTGNSSASVSNQTAKPSFGITGSTVTSESSVSVGMPEAFGVWISSVAPSSLAERTGLKQGDVIQTVDDKRISTFDELSGLISKATPGSTMKLGVWRDKQMTVITVVFSGQI
jgi:membrane-associated protease RseP (regulator of RpoE activity)